MQAQVRAAAEAQAEPDKAAGIPAEAVNSNTPAVVRAALQVLPDAAYRDWARSDTQAEQAVHWGISAERAALRAVLQEER